MGTDIPDQLKQHVEGILNQNPGISVEEPHRRIAERADSYSRAPQADMAGLSPNQMTSLLGGGWDGANAGIRVRADLDSEELAGCDQSAQRMASGRGRRRGAAPPRSCQEAE